jgi:hypothetical protein
MQDMSSSTRKLIGVGAVLAALAILAPPGPKAQTLMPGADTTRERSAFMDARCGHILDATQRVGCRAQASIDFDEARAAAAKRRIETAKQGMTLEEQLQRCTAFLRTKRDSGVVFDRKITRENVCPYARELGMKDGPG